MYRLALLTFGLAASHLYAADLPSEKQIDEKIEGARLSWHVPGIAVVIVDGTRPIYLKGHGTRVVGKDLEITPDTVFPLASCSKAFTTTLLAMLVDDKKLDWDDSPRKYLPSFHLSEPAADQLVSLRDMVSHRTGVSGHDLLWYRAPWSLEESIRRTGKLPLSQPFRSAMQYQSTMFTAAGFAAAKAGGKPWEELVKERIFTPLEMKSASARYSDAVRRKDLAGGHRIGEKGEAETMPPYECPEPNPAGSVFTSARDLAPWLNLHLNGGRNGESRLVSEANLEVTHTPHIPILMDENNQRTHPDTHLMSYAMGWVVQDYRGEMLISHAGLIDGYRVHLTLIPKRKLALAILCNLDRTRMNLALSNTLVDLLLGLPEKDWNAHYKEIVAGEEFNEKMTARRMEELRNKTSKPTLPLEAYAGKYEDAAYGKAIVHLEKGQLIWEWSSFRCPLSHFQDDIFRIDDAFFKHSLLQFEVKEKKAAGMRALDVEFRRE